MIRTGSAPAPAPQVDPIERIVLGWPSQIVGGEVHYYDAVAGLYRTLEESVVQLAARRRAQGILGSQRDADAVTAYERSRGL
jgi:hypothetical protein